MSQTGFDVRKVYKDTGPGMRLEQDRHWKQARTKWRNKQLISQFIGVKKSLC